MGLAHEAACRVVCTTAVVMGVCGVVAGFRANGRDDRPIGKRHEAGAAIGAGQTGENMDQRNEQIGAVGQGQKEMESFHSAAQGSDPRWGLALLHEPDRTHGVR